MSKIQLDRLRNDLTELEQYINKVKKKGNKDLVSKLKRKYEFLSTRIAEAS
jgi:uncharacterized membrane protein (DUF106 family)